MCYNKMKKFTALKAGKIMNYNLNLGMWKSVFAVPSEIVDSHIKLAGAAQLKVILWVLRHAGENFTVEDIAKALSMQSADVRDCMQYWSETGVISINDGIVTPAAETQNSDDTQNIQTNIEEMPLPDVQPVITDVRKEKPQQKRVLSRPEKPDIKYLTRRMDEDSSIAYLMQSADEIFGRMTSNNDKATLLLIHEYDGLPVEVIIMLLQYAFSMGKVNMRYIEKMAVSWADEEITTLERAEKKIQQLTSGHNAAKLIQRTLGLDEHSPTEKETAYAESWVNIWHFTPDMIREAYERCVDAKGKYIPSYTNTILERWHNVGINTVEQARSEQNSKKSKPKDGYGATYDISEYESTSVLDEEW